MNILIALMVIVACITCSAAAPRRQVCPLQCSCYKRPDGWIDVNCPRSNFSSVPEFPDRTITVTIQRSAKVEVIQNNAFSHLTNLQKLHLTSTVPLVVSEKAFHKLIKLWSLTLVVRYTTTLPESSFADSTSLTTLYLSLQLANIPHHIICKLQKLNILSLGNNKLNNVSFDHCFSSLSSLSTVRLSQNPIRVLSGHEFKAFRFINISELDLGTCQLTEIGRDTFQYLGHLRILTLTNNKLTALPEGGFSGLLFLKSLSLETNLLTTMPCVALEPLTNILVLNLNHNKMTNMTMCSIFRNFSSLRELYLVDDRISSMDDDFFQSLATSNLSTLHLTVYRLSLLTLKPLKRLKYIKLRGKMQNSSYLQYVMQGLAESDIRGIDATNLNLPTIIDEDMFVSLSKTNLSKLKIHSSRIKGVSVNTFSPLSKLTVLDLSHNRITNFPVGTFRMLVALKQLILVDNIINTIGLDRWCLQDNLLKLNLGNNNIRHLGQNSLKGLTRLEKIQLSNNFLEGLPNKIFRGTNIKQIILSVNYLKSLPNELFRMITNIEIIYIKQNEITLTNKLNPKSPFADLKNVTDVGLANFIIESNYKHFGNFFNNLTSLNSLELTYWRIQVLPVNLFLGTHNLDILTLTNNEIASWEPKLFKPLYKLRELFLNRNKIVSISKEAFYYLPNLRRLDLSDNALACNCELMWFREWIETAFIYIPNVQNKHSYHCEAPERFKGVAFLDFSLPEIDCLAFSLIKLSVTFSTVIILFLISAGLVYRFRFEVQMFMFYVRSRQQRLLDGIDNLEYVFDAYVIYSSEDRRWVLDKLMAYLENSQGYRLCIEDRDWLGGRAIVDNIIESIASSRRVILVLSAEFVRNSWCVETAEMAQSHLLNRNKNALLPILLANIPSENLPPSIRSVFATRTLLPWPKCDTNKRKQERKEDKFWKTLNDALKKRIR